MSDPQEVLQALRDALAGKDVNCNKKQSIDNVKESKPEDDDISHQKVKSKNLS